MTIDPAKLAKLAQATITSAKQLKVARDAESAALTDHLTAVADFTAYSLAGEPEPQSEPIETPPANVESEQVLNVVGTNYFGHVHLSSPADVFEILPPPRIEWRVFNAKGDIVLRRPGYVVELPQDLGETGRRYGIREGEIARCYVDGVQAGPAYRARFPASPSVKTVAIGTDLATLPAGAYALPAGGFAASGSLSDDVILLGAGIGKTRITYTGSQFGWSMWGDADGVVIRGCTIVNSYPYDHELEAGKNPARKQACNFIEPGTDSTFVGVELVGWNDGFAMSANSVRVCIVGCVGTAMIGNFIWFAGEDIFIADNTCLDSKLEHIARGQKYNRVTLHNNRFNNERHIEDPDPATRDANNDWKGTIVPQDGKYCYVAGNDLTGGANAGFGPLAVVGNGDPSQTTTGVVWEDNQMDNGGVDVHPGIIGFRVSGNPVRQFNDDDARPITNGVVPAGTRIPSNPKKTRLVNVTAAAA